MDTPEVRQPESSAEATHPRETSGPSSGGGATRRVFQAFGPVLGGMALDLLDLASFGPVGVFGGLAIGGLFGWWISGVYGMSERRRPWVALASGVYCALPMTEALPLATIFTVISRLAGSSDEGSPER